MLTATPIKSAKDAAKYYYGKGEWYGKGSQSIGLSGNIDKKDFISLLEGKVENIQLGRKTQEGVEHRPGYDFTFSAPKSVSYMAEVAQDTRLHKAHTEAVKIVLDLIERKYIDTRVTQNCITSLEKVDNLVIGLFRHNDSRELDPQLHTHAVVMNMTKHLGKWMSIESKKVFQLQKFLGQIYRLELAKRVKDLGYEIIMHGKESFFDIKGLPQGLLQHFSKRRVQILNALEKYDVVNAKTAEQANLMTRKSKKSVENSILVGEWQKASKEFGFDPSKAIEKLCNQKKHSISADKLQEETNERTKSSKTIANFIERKFLEFCNKFKFDKNEKLKNILNNTDEYKKNNQSLERIAVEYAVSHISERSSVWKEDKLLEAVMHFATGKLTYDKILKEIELMKSKGLLIAGKYNGLLTTKEAIKKEKETIAMMKEGINKSDKIIPATALKSYIKTTDLNIGQQKAVELITTSKDRVVAIQGYAGTGKTHMLKVVKKIADHKKWKIIGMSASASAASTLQKSSGIESKTIHKFLFKYDGVIHGRGTSQGRKAMKKELKNTLLVLDEASLASTSQLHGLLKVSKALDVKVVLVGDKKQLGGVEAGKPFEQLQEYGMQTAVMDKIQRQKNQVLKEAVYKTIDGKIQEALEKIGKNIIEPTATNNSNKKIVLAKLAADKWLSLSVNERSKTLITAPSNEIRQEINQTIREYLKFENSIIGKDYKLEKFNNKGLTQAEKSFAGNYVVGDIVRFNKDYKSLNIKRNEYLEVKDVSNFQVITLAKENGKTIYWNPKKIAGNRKGAVEIYQKSYIDIAKGEQLQWSRNSSKFSSIINSQTFKVLDIDQNNKTIKLELESGEKKEYSLNNKDLKHIDYSYSSTVHSAQGKTYNYVIGILESQHPNLTNQPMFYVTLSRAKIKAELITDNLKLLSQNLELQTGKRIAALEHYIFRNERGLPKNKEFIKEHEIEIKKEPKSKSDGYGI